MTQVEGVKQITSTRAPGQRRITVELDMSRNVDLALQDVQAQGRARRSAGCRGTSIRPSSPSRTPTTSRSCGRRVRARSRGRCSRLRALPGEGAAADGARRRRVTLGGSLERNVRIWLDAQKLDAQRAHRHRHHRRAPARARRAARRPLETGGPRVNVRLLGEALDLETLRKLVVREEQRPRRSTSRTWRSSRTASRTCAASRASTASPRRRWASSSSAAPTPSPWPQAVRAELAEIQKTLPEGMKVEHPLRLHPVHRGVGPRDRVRAAARGAS